MRASADILVVGGGPAGCMAALAAAEAGARVRLLEKSAQPCRKLLLTGNGRCNLTNTAPPEAFLERFGKQGQFLRQALYAFDSRDLIDFFEARGVRLREETGGRVFTETGRASDVMDALVKAVRDAGVEIVTGTPVARILVSGNRVEGVAIGSLGNRISARAVILAVGGASYPVTGSTGDGVRIAGELGLAVVPLRPALVPLESPDAACARLQGLSLTGVRLTVTADGQSIAKIEGDMLFTHFGISGPAVLSISKSAGEALAQGKSVSVLLDLTQDRDAQALDKRLCREWDQQGRCYIGRFLDAFLPGKLVDVILERAGVATDKPVSKVSSEERQRLVGLLKGFPISLSKTRPLAEAMVTVGGVALNGVDPRTLASRTIQGLYFAGEVLDIDGDTGGFNLQAAFSMGRMAGAVSAAELLQRESV
ncbi:MAG: aminoacetone oxidase family FAD-binding enzyme [Fibrobacterota bacterium]